MTYYQKEKLGKKYLPHEILHPVRDVMGHTRTDTRGEGVCGCLLCGALLADW